MVRLAGICLLLVAACKPEIEGRPSEIVGPRVLAVRSQPADAKPSETISYDALFVDSEGLGDPAALDWALCLAGKSLTQPGTVSAECLTAEGDEIGALGSGGAVMATIPKDACALFGPTPQTPEAGQPASRPVDPDTTGGYYQPVRVLETAEESGAYSVGVTRLSCGLGGATQAQAADFTRRSKPNQNPELEVLLAIDADDNATALPALDSEQSLSVPAGSELTLYASWPECPLEPECGDGICSPGEDSSPSGCPDDCREPRGCRGSEPYVYFDPVSRELRDRREAIRISWYATAGQFKNERTGSSESQADQSTTENTWTAPDGEAAVKLWVVIRDDRGGVGWGSYQLEVE
jgi:hypothetical protein